MTAKYLSSPLVPYEVGFDIFPDRKRPLIVIKEGNHITSYGSFRDEEHANEWFDKLFELVGAKYEQ